MTCKDCIHERLCVIKAFPDMFENTKWDKEPCDHFKNEADFVEVVRCQNCKRFMEYAEGKQHIEGADGDCSIRMMHCSDEQFWGVAFNDYCSYWKRKEGAKR